MNKVAPKWFKVSLCIIFSLMIINIMFFIVEFLWVHQSSTRILSNLWEIFFPLYLLVSTLIIPYALLHSIFAKIAVKWSVLWGVMLIKLLMVYVGLIFILGNALQG